MLLGILQQQSLGLSPLQPSEPSTSSGTGTLRMRDRFTGEEGIALTKHQPELGQGWMLSSGVSPIIRSGRVVGDGAGVGLVRVADTALSKTMAPAVEVVIASFNTNQLLSRYNYISLCQMNIAPAYVAFRDVENGHDYFRRSGAELASSIWVDRVLDSGALKEGDRFKLAKTSAGVLYAFHNDTEVWKRDEGDAQIPFGWPRLSMTPHGFELSSYAAYSDWSR